MPLNMAVDKINSAKGTRMEVVVVDVAPAELMKKEVTIVNGVVIKP